MTNMKTIKAICVNNQDSILCTQGNTLNNNFEILSEQVKFLNNNFKQMNYTIKCIKKNKWKRGLYNAKRKYY